MLLKRLPSTPLTYTFRRTFHKNSVLAFRKDDREFEHPLTRTVRILMNDLKTGFTQISKGQIPHPVVGFPQFTDVLIVGGGAIGSSIAYWLKEKSNPDSFHVAVIEQDPTYAKCATTLSVGGLRQQFSLPENINLSLFGAEFIRSLKKRFGPEADISFTPHGYLVLASEEGAEQLIENSKLQNELGAINVILPKHNIKDRFPWLNVDDVEVGCLGLEKEGWFDPWSLLQLLKTGAEKKNAQYIHGEVVEFLFQERDDIIIKGREEGSFLQHPIAAVIKMPDGEIKTINFAICIIAAGPQSGQIAQKLDIGVGEGLLSVPLPVEPRKRYVYVVECEKDPPGLNTPMTIDHTGAYFRRDGLGGKFICGISPEIGDEPDVSNLDVNYEYFDKRLWPILAQRVPAFNALKVKGAWSGFYDFNKFDENGIVGPHPLFTNVYIATGFSGHGT
ncbi:hypothetical protein ABEB36_008161 [Hypothenemus hampei]|uniref:FAD dependent oxidoreductase domain-containing protein n=1 Tax=Hypothenemus hampei TaxID=57062 RepID=A0ABD1EKY3_HYPHA